MPSWLRRSRDTKPAVSIPVEYRLAMVYQVYFAAVGPPPDPAELLRSSAAWRDDHVRTLRRGMSEVWHDRFLSVRVLPVEELPFQPPVALLRQSGLGELQERVVEAATHGVVLGCGDLNTPPRIGLWSALALALAVADLLDGVVLDPDARRVLDRDTAAGWFNDLALISASQHVTVPFSVGHERGLGLMTTCGMEKFGLPNLLLADVPPHLDTMAEMVTAVGQLLSESVLRTARERQGEIQSVEVPGEVALDRALFRRAYARELDEPDPDPRPLVRVGLRFGREERAQDPPMIRLVPPAGEPDTGVWLQAACRAMVQDTDEVEVPPGDVDGALQRAHERAVAELPDVKLRFAEGLAPGEVLFVKHGFETPSGGLEWMWIAVSQWANGQVAGQLVNTPRDVPSLQAGATVTVDEQALYDWMLGQKGGRVEGAYTDQVLRQGRAER